MTILKCSAHNCYYNKDSLCSKGAINVEGADARYADDTACESFRDQKEDSATNAADSGCGCETINIDCKAHNCTYNEHCKCTAASINVSVIMHIAAVIQNVILSAVNADILN